MAERSEKNSIGTVVEVLPNTTFKVRFENGKDVLCYLAGKMRMFKIKVTIGDKVKVTTSEYGEDKGRIIQRM